MTPDEATDRLIAEIRSGFDTPCDLETVRALLAAGARPDAVDSSGDTCLLQCVKSHRDAATVKLLIEAGAALETPSSSNFTALGHAAWGGRTEIALALIEAGANVEIAVEDGTSALLLALNSGHTTIAKALIEHGANIDARGFKEGVTPLMSAVTHDLHDIIPMLLEKGCNINAVRENAFHDTALGLADEMGSPAAAVIRGEIFRRADAERQRELDAEIRQITEKRDMLQGMANDMHAGAQQPVAVRTLRFKNTAAPA